MPFLPWNREYVDAYNALCTTFQIDSLKLANVHLFKETENIEAELNTLIEANPYLIM